MCAHNSPSSKKWRKKDRDRQFRTVVHIVADRSCSAGGLHPKGCGHVAGMIGGSPRILIIRLSAIGDVVRALPLLHGLRAKHPQGQIDWAVEPKAADVVRNHPALDQLLVYDRPRSIWRGARSLLSFVRMVRGMHYDIVVDAHGILKSGAICGSSGAGARWGFAPPRSREGSAFFTNQKVTLSGSRLNRIAENLQLCRALGADANEHDMSIYVPSDVQEYVDHFFDEQFEAGKRVIAVHVPVDRPEKQWPLESFARLADMLIADGRFEVLMTWGPGQLKTVVETISRMKRKPVISPETPDLKHLAWTMHRAHLYFGGDTGPMHIAAAMGTPVIALFGGTHPEQHAPLAAPHQSLYAGDIAMPPPNEIRAAVQLLERITPEAAYDACVEMISRR
jgi:lipopolysaccharide heptosyltransferase I